MNSFSGALPGPVKRETYLERYKKRLATIPAPGGNGCHIALLGCANLGVMAGLKPEKIHEDLRRGIPQGKRHVTDSEIAAAIEKALRDHQKDVLLPTGEFYRPYRPPKPEPAVKDPSAVVKKLIEQSKIRDDADVWELSPVRLDCDPSLDAIEFLISVFDVDDLIFIGERQDTGEVGKTIRPVGDWIEFFANGGENAPFICVNPLTGKPAQKKDGSGITFRGDANVSTFKYCIAEFDNLSREDQLNFWTSVKLPVTCLVDSGGKSIHAWIDVQKLAKITSLDSWNREIKGRLYESALTCLGVDSACSNPARLARLPGHRRAETGNFQKILFLNT